MPLKLTAADHNAMDKYLDGVLNAYRDGTISLSIARGDLAHAISAAAIDNEGLKDYFRLDLQEKWNNLID